KLENQGFVVNSLQIPCNVLYHKAGPPKLSRCVICSTKSPSDSLRDLIIVILSFLTQDEDANH
ncbi:MAG: hypothetical protein ACUVUE_01610, partial [Candidatus Bathycorpusculaceae bacterium]